MPRNALLDETKTQQWPVGLPGWADKVRLQPTIEAILDRCRRATQGKGDQLIHGALKLAIIERIVADDLHAAYTALGEILGLTHPVQGTAHPNGDSGNTSGASARSGNTTVPVGKSLPIREAR